IVYDEYIPQQDIDTDLEERIKNFLLDSANINSFLMIMPFNLLDGMVYRNSKYPLIINYTAKANEDAENVLFNGGAIPLPANFLKLVSFRHSEWVKTLSSEDVINENSPVRRLQGNEYTEGGTTRPVISIENLQYEDGIVKKSLLFWGYRIKMNNFSTFTFLRNAELTPQEKETTPDLEPIDFILSASLQDYNNTIIADLYIYYALILLARVSLRPEEENAFTKTFQQLLDTYNIVPSLPINFNNKNK
ncbi:MAG: hypothetical protein HUJ68_08655, partial [Clostridia bacterium]|nr:hypothetical protein [Clostridia bacterium]